MCWPYFGHGQAVRRGGNASLFEDALDWLSLAETMKRCMRVSQIVSPLEAFGDMPSFKIYLCGTCSPISKSDAQCENTLNGVGPSFMGAVAESSVAQAVADNGNEPHCWSCDNRTEVDFIVERQGSLSAVEVKRGENTRARSLASLRTNKSAGGSAWYPEF